MSCRKASMKNHLYIKKNLFVIFVEFANTVYMYMYLEFFVLVLFYKIKSKYCPCIYFVYTTTANPRDQTWIHSGEK